MKHSIIRTNILLLQFSWYRLPPLLSQSPYCPTWTSLISPLCLSHFSGLCLRVSKQYLRMGGTMQRCRSSPHFWHGCFYSHPSMNFFKGRHFNMHSHKERMLHDTPQDNLSCTLWVRNSGNILLWAKSRRLLKHNYDMVSRSKVQYSSINSK